MQVVHYLTTRGQNPFLTWLAALRDKRAQVAVIRRIDRLADGNFGDCKPCQDGVWEMRIDLGPGYRVYYAQEGKTVTILLCGGTKRAQRKDIERAVAYWKDYQTRI